MFDQPYILSGCDGFEILLEQWLSLNSKGLNILQDNPISLTLVSLSGLGYVSFTL